MVLMEFIIIWINTLAGIEAQKGSIITVFKNYLSTVLPPFSKTYWAFFLASIKLPSN